MSLIMLTNTSASTIAAGNTIPLPTIARRKGTACQLGSNGVLLTKAGYYKVSGTITFVGSATGNVSIALYKNGVVVPGIGGAVTIGTASTENHTIPIDGIVRVMCYEGQPTLTLVVTGVGITTSNVELTVVD